MNPVFMAAVVAHGGTETAISSSSLPGTIPANIRPPGEPAPEPVTTGSTMSLASAESRPVPAPKSASSGGLFTGLFSSSGGDSSKKTNGDSSGMLDRMSHLVGLRGSDSPAADQSQASKAKTAAAKPTQTASAAAGAIRAKPTGAAASPEEGNSADQKPAGAGAKPEQAPASAAPSTSSAANASNPAGQNGSQAPLPANSFDSRWAVMR
jgi:hypothetical protein